ncbi:MAG: formylglycine-generating enzyme family protein, partial [Chloroflexi bacterium]|nr:formylglycine-generating enzyme family protein [Chloroflexota bacterium]
SDTPVPPTNTPAPSDTPVPPTNTPAPSDTPVPPTNTPTPSYDPAALAALAFSQTAYNADWTPFTKVFDGVEMALVPAGCYEMGITGEGGRQCFYAPFWIDVTEVTNAEYRRCVEAGRCAAPTNRIYYDDPAFDRVPAVHVPWLEADLYARWRGCHLPSEREWEYAARGPDNLLYPWGGTFDGTLLNSCDANCLYPRADSTASDGFAYLAPVGSYPGGASWVGALDMSGNAAEWTGSLEREYPYNADAAEDSGTDRRSDRIIRGGDWNDDRGMVRTIYRAWGNPAAAYEEVGFRCARAYRDGDLTP